MNDDLDDVQRRRLAEALRRQAVSCELFALEIAEMLIAERPDTPAARSATEIAECAAARMRAAIR